MESCDFLLVFYALIILLCMCWPQVLASEIYGSFSNNLIMNECFNGSVNRGGNYWTFV